MYTFTATIEGTAPLLMHRLDPISIIKGTGPKTKNTTAFEGNPEEWKTGCYWEEDSGLFVAADAIETAVKMGAASGGYKVGSPKRPARQYVASGLILAPERVSITLPGESSSALKKLNKKGPMSFNGEQPDFVDLRVVTIQRSRMCRYRVMIPAGWRATFSGEMLHDQITPELLQELISYAGTFKGLYEYRPKLGRYAVAEFQNTQQ